MRELLRRPAWLFSTLVLGIGWASVASAIVIRDDSAVAAYDALATQNQFQAAGYLGHPGAPQSFCSGVLIAADKFLTAAHCLANPDGTFTEIANNLTVGFDLNFPAGGLPANNVSAFFVNPAYSGEGGARQYDVAVVELSEAIVGVTPASIWLANPVGLLGTMIGYGDQANGFGNPLIGANDRLGAQNIIDISAPTIRTDFDKPDGTTSSFGATLPVYLEGTTAGGDSGGPLFASRLGQELLVGDVSGGFNPFNPDAPSQYGDVSIWAPLRDPVNVGFLESLNQPIRFVPDPPTFALLGIGLAGLGFNRRRRAR